LRESIDFNDLVQGDGTMFETDLANMGKLTAVTLVTFLYHGSSRGFFAGGDIPEPNP